MQTYKIVQRKNPHAVYAIFDFGPTYERAQTWLENYDSRMWDDKTVTRNDLLIVPA
jgi:hypothetical protein